MFKYEILRNEEAFVEKLTEKERQIYLFDDEMQRKLAALNNSIVDDFLQKALVLNELHRTHEVYNKLYDKYVLPVSQQTDASIAFDDLLNDSLRMTISISGRAAVVELCIMDDCDDVYNLLGNMKMRAFDAMYNYSTAAEQLENI